MMDNLFVLDFETTGLNPYLNDVIEIAVKKIGTNKKWIGKEPKMG